MTLPGHRHPENFSDSQALGDFAWGATRSLQPLHQRHTTQVTTTDLRRVLLQALSPFACTLPLVGEGGRFFHTVALMAMARGMAGRKDKPLVAIEFAEDRVRHEVAA